MSRIDTDLISPNRAIDNRNSADKPIPEDKPTSEAEELAYREGKDRLDREKELHDLRKDEYKKLYKVIKNWLNFISIIIVLHLILVAFGKPSLTDAVLIALMTTSTATVLGVFAIAAKWLFPKL